MVLRYKVIYTIEALGDLDEIFEFLSGVAWRGSARKWVLRILMKVDALAVFPEGHPRYRFDEECRFVRVGKYIIIYMVDERTRSVRVLRIVYGRRDLGEVGLEK